MSNGAIARALGVSRPLVVRIVQQQQQQQQQGGQ